jgi:hypothetical protein
MFENKLQVLNFFTNIPRNKFGIDDLYQKIQNYKTYSIKKLKKFFSKRNRRLQCRI